MDRQAEFDDLIHQMEIAKYSGPNIMANVTAGLDFYRNLPQWKQLISGKYHQIIRHRLENPALNLLAAELYQVISAESPKIE